MEEQEKNSKLAEIIQDGLVLSENDFSIKYENIFKECGLLNKKGSKSAFTKIASYYTENYAGILRKEDKKKAFQFKESSEEILRDTLHNKSTHLVILMRIDEKITLPIDTFVDEHQEIHFFGAHSIESAERIVRKVESASNNHALKLANKVLGNDGKYPLPDGVSINDFPPEIRQQIELVEKMYAENENAYNLLQKKEYDAAVTVQILIPLENKNPSSEDAYIAVQPADCPSVMRRLSEKISESKKASNIPNHTEAFKAAGKKQNFGLDEALPFPLFVLTAIPFPANEDSINCILIKRDFKKWLKRHCYYDLREEFQKLKALRQRIDAASSTSSRDRNRQVKLLCSIARRVHQKLAELQKKSEAQELLDDKFQAGNENWEDISREIVKWVNQQIRPTGALQAITGEETLNWQEVILDFLVNHSISEAEAQ